MSLDWVWFGYLHLNLYIIWLTKTIISAILLFSELLHKIMKSLNLEHSVQKHFFFNIYIWRHFASDEISVQVSSFSESQGRNVAELALSQLADILSVALQYYTINNFWNLRLATSSAWSRRTRKPGHNIIKTFSFINGERGLNKLERSFLI